MAASNNSVRVEHIEQATRILHTWSPSKIRMAKLQADSGSMMLVSDLCEDMIADDSIKGTLDIRVKGLFGLPLEFEPEGDKRKTSPVIKALTADWWKMNPEQALGQSWSWAIMLGVSVAELVIRENQGRVLPKLKHWHPRWLKFDWTTRAWMLNTQGGEVTLEIGNGKWMLFTPGGEHRPWANGAWRAVALWWLLKQYALTDWARYSEAHGKPILVGVMPATAQGDPQARKDLANDLGDLGNDTSVALPPGYDLRLVEAVANTWQTFKAQIEMADAGIAVAILGQNLTTRVSDGSRAAASVHNDVRGDLKRSDAETLATITREQQLVYWAEWNFGNRDLSPWPKWITDPPEDLKLEAEKFAAIAATIAQMRKVGLSTAALLEKFGLEVDPTSTVQNEMFEYHLKYGVVTVNEVRQYLGLEPTKGGDVPVSTPDVQLPAGPPKPVTKAQLNSLTLASGKPVSSVQAFLDGQLYADALGDHALSLDVFKPQLAAVLEAISTATDYDDLRSRLLIAHDGMNADEAQEFIARAMILASMAGQYSASLEDEKPEGN